MPKNRSSCGKLNIGFDLDGVIIDHTQSKIEIAKSFGFRVRAKETQSEVLKNILPQDKYKELQRLIYTKTTLGAPPVANALKVLKKLVKRGDCNFFVISRRKKGGRGLARRWFEKHKLYEIVPKKNIYFVGEEGDKNLYCKKLKVKIYLDDKVKILDMFSSVPWPVFFNPHKVSHNKKYLEISSWRDFPRLLEKLKKGAKLP